MQNETCYYANPTVVPTCVERYLDLIQYTLVSRIPGDLIQYTLVSRTPGDLIQYNLVRRTPGDLIQYNLVSITLGDRRNQFVLSEIRINRCH